MTKNRITRNWIAVGVIWIGTLVLTHFNSQAVEQIKTNRAAMESMRMDSIFIKNNFEKISRIFNRRSALHKSIDSLQIELVALENMLKIRAKQTGLSNFQIVGEPISKGIDQVSLKFNANGTYREMASWLKNLESDVAYLVVNQVDMQTDAGVKERAFSLNIYFRYKLAAGDEEAA